ncbi:MAG: AI-2E family transporter [Gemmatimonadota bacterium]
MAKVQAEHEWPTIYVAVVALSAFAFLFSVKSVLSPVIAFLVLVLLISPWAGTRMHLLTIVAATSLLVIWLLATLGSLVAPFVLAFVLAYILDPLVDRLERRGLKRGLAVAVVFVPVLIVLVLAAILGLPALAQQVQQLIEQVPTALQRGITWIQNLRVRALNANLPFVTGEALARALDNFSPERVTDFINMQQAEIASRLWGAVLGVGKGIGILLGILGYFVLTPVLTIYLLKDFDKLVARASGLIPRDKRDTWIPFIVEYDRLLAGYLRGQILAALIVGLLTYIGLLLIGFPNPGVVAAVAGVFNLIPYLGLVVSAIPALVISLLSDDIVASLIKAAIVFAVVQTIDGTITGPRIVGGSVGLHPVWVILALAVGSSFFGFTGLLLAMPAAVLIKVIVRNAVERYRTSRVYEGEPLQTE